MTKRWEWLEEDHHEDSIGPWTICDENDNDVANVYSDENATGPKISRKKSIANVRLMAAAPDLLEALKALAEAADDPDRDTLMELRAARSAIAKAEGRS